MMDKHWLMQAKTIRKLWRGFAGVLVITVVAGFFTDLHAHFGIDGSVGFYAWYGFVTCLFMVVFAKLAGFILKRGEDYYDD